MKEFNLEEYLKNPDRVIVDRDGRPVEILKTDYGITAEDDKPIQK